MSMSGPMPRVSGEAHVRVVIAEDEALLREGLSLLLNRAGFDVVGAVGNADDLLSVTARERPDVVLTDIRMPPGGLDDGLRAAVEIRRAHPGTGVLVVSQHVQQNYTLELLADDAEGVGYLLKQRISDVDGFCQTLRDIAGGGTAIDPEVVDAMLSGAGGTHSALASLSPRQRDVLSLIAQGLSNAAIGERLFITERTVVQHASKIYEELGLFAATDHHRRVLAVLKYLGA